MSIPTLFSYLPFEVAVSICKLAGNEAEEGPAVDPMPAPSPKPPEAQKKPSILGTLAGHAAGMGVGTLVGYGAGELADRAYRFANPGQGGIPSSYHVAVGPVVGAGLGLAYTLAKAHEQEELRRALTNADHGPPGGATRG